MAETKQIIIRSTEEEKQRIDDYCFKTSRKIGPWMLKLALDKIYDDTENGGYKL